MCLAVPGRLLERWQDEAGLPLGRVAFGAVRREVCLAYTPQAQPGDTLIVHVGFAIQILDEEAARESLAIWAQIEDATEPEPS